MGNVSKAHLTDKDIRNLEPKNKRYIKAVGDPKELYIFVNPEGIKTFEIRYKGKYKKIKEFRENVYSVAEARRDAIAELKRLENGGTFDNRDDKFKFGNLLEIFFRQKYKQNSKDYTDKMYQAFKRYILPKFKDRDIKDIKQIELLEVLNPIFRPENITASRLELIDRLINYMRDIFDIAINNDYISKNPTRGLKEYFPSKHNFYSQNDYDPRKKGLIKENEIKEWIKDLRERTKISDEVRRMVLFQVLSANRPANTVKIKWEWIDYENKVLNYPASAMKRKIRHSVPLSTYLLKILETQKLYSGNFEYVFPIFGYESMNEEQLKKAHENRINNLNKACKNMGGKDKWKGKLTAHGFRKTFKTLCNIHTKENGANNDTIEDCIAHKQRNKVEYSYQLERATIEQKRALLQWYGDYLNSIEPLGI
ncbi:MULTISPECIES: tyrosine-type recombinase/integrase [unclassified Campylobacter]|uniref:tyrosine-type recombinase/integrase n=1 Tax=unclassified Campylobacter TaxID=2593542 RepID=UPI0022E9F5A3|nr:MULTISPECIES: site-specific integrase [unclassified Campylobacter]MDA3054946.1 tyrosine-type recombinase/integrase [Campylobacter sp. VBCF_07 NA4]MDA3060448.1 tyrosine-type recombinase/integrase [Campylobacter sp. VBCF_02 NA5]MDA3070286.1 tyrosine-type recombinase/integrase [Campylobacter sp. VBCF_08 NA3]WBR54716.1 tyrosine-type recombinase/integrase [Campylobacter sp. VBCF_01 NA2]